MRRRSFTLLETLLGVIIIALIASGVGYGYYRSLDRVVLQSAGYELLNMAQYARLTAGQKHQPCRIYVDLTEGTYWLTEQQMGIAVESGAAEDVGQELTVQDHYARPKKLSPQVRFKQVLVDGAVTEVGEAVIEFYTDGSAQAGLIQIGGKKKTYTLLIYPWTGRAELAGRAIDVCPLEVTDLDAVSSLNR